MKCPCKECITFVICKPKIKRLIRKHRVIDRYAFRYIPDIFLFCPMLKDYLNIVKNQGKDSYHTGVDKLWNLLISTGTK